jgi:hypothetical protein
MMSHDVVPGRAKVPLGSRGVWDQHQSRLYCTILLPISIKKSARLSVRADGIWMLSNFCTNITKFSQITTIHIKLSDIVYHFMNYYLHQDSRHQDASLTHCSCEKCQ